MFAALLLYSAGSEHAFLVQEFREFYVILRFIVKKLAHSSSESRITDVMNRMNQSWIETARPLVVYVTTEKFC